MNEVGLNSNHISCCWVARNENHGVHWETEGNIHGRIHLRKRKGENFFLKCCVFEAWNWKISYHSKSNEVRRNNHHLSRTESSRSIHAEVAKSLISWLKHTNQKKEEETSGSQVFCSSVPEGYWKTWTTGERNKIWWGSNFLIRSTHSLGLTT